MFDHFDVLMDHGINTVMIKSGFFAICTCNDFGYPYDNLKFVIILEVHFDTIVLHVFLTRDEKELS